jgi:hypothetical protein
MASGGNGSPSHVAGELFDMLTGSSWSTYRIAAVGDFVPGYEASTWEGLGAPRRTPAEIIDKLNKEINAGLAAPNMKARLADLGLSLLAGSPADFGRLIVNETEKWAKVIRAANIKPV